VLLPLQVELRVPVRGGHSAEAEISTAGLRDEGLLPSGGSAASADDAPSKDADEAGPRIIISACSV
jgi:hypothetical protein